MVGGQFQTRPPTLTVGVDTVRVSEVLASIESFGNRYLDRVFTAHEQASCVGPDHIRARGLAARFAAKEATFKALRPDDLSGAWTAIEIRRQPGGWTDIELHGRAAAHAHRTGVRNLSVSMTHDGDVATAVVVAVADSTPTHLTDTASGDLPCPTS